MSEQNKLSTQSLDNKNEDIAQQIIDAKTVEETRDLTALFNLNAQKRNVLRVLKMTISLPLEILLFGKMMIWRNCERYYLK